MKPQTKKQKRNLIILVIFFSAFSGLGYALNMYFNIFDINNILFALICGVVGILFRLMHKDDDRKYRRGVEHGSARWGRPEDIAPFIDPNGRNNIILTDTESLSMQTHLPQPKQKYERAKNVLVIGSVGTSKTRGFGIPNILQMHSSYVITDPKGEIHHKTKKILKKYGYSVRFLDLKNFNRSMGYNPFDYIVDEKDPAKLADIIVNSTIASAKEKGGGDRFWIDGEKMLYTAIIGYIKFFLPDKSQHNFRTMVNMIRSIKVKETSSSKKYGQDNSENYVIDCFENMRRAMPNHAAVISYDFFMQGADKTLQSFIISCGARLYPLFSEQVLNTLSTDQMSLGTIGDRKTALFIITDATSKTYHFIAAMLYSQMFSTLRDVAETKYEHQGRHLPVHVRCILDEFANMGRIPEFENVISYVRSYRISVNIILQSLSQLKSAYKDDWHTIIGNCQSKLFLGGDDEETLKYFTRVLGKETIDTIDNSQSTGKTGSSSKQYKKQGRELMTTDELARLDGDKCILVLSGTYPFLSRKYRIEKHPRYREMEALNKGTNLIKKPPQSSTSKPPQKRPTSYPSQSKNRQKPQPKQNTRQKPLHK